MLRLRLLEQDARFRAGAKTQGPSTSLRFGRDDRVMAGGHRDSIDSPSCTDRLGSPFHAEQEARLSQIASRAGTDTGRVVGCRREFVGASMGEFPDGRRPI